MCQSSAWQVNDYTKSVMFTRNRYFVDNADMLLAAYDGQTGGTQMTVKYAKQMGNSGVYDTAASVLNLEVAMMGNHCGYLFCF